jgi:hypothetical protein
MPFALQSLSCPLHADGQELFEVHTHALGGSSDGNSEGEAIATLAERKALLSVQHISIVQDVQID